jgi:DNA ligase-associated metallophosphoesterase
MSAPANRLRGNGAAEIRLNGARLTADPSGALLWPERRTLVVADLHFEKGSAFAKRGLLLPPYDTRATLDRLETLIARHRPARVVCLGDSFHDGEAGERLAPGDRARLARLAGTCDWVWIEGNHDPEPPDDLGGRAAAELIDPPLVFRHRAKARGAKTRGAKSSGAVGEVSGHWHPKAAVHLPPKRITAPCFVSDGRRLVLPAFGAYTGGLNVLDPAVSGLFENGFVVHLARRDKIYVFQKDILIF